MIVEQVFDDGSMATSRAELAELIERVAPVTLSTERLRPVPEPLRPLFPMGGLQPGWTIGFDGDGASSLVAAFAAEIMGSDGWVALVGVGGFNLAAASELGLPLDRVVVVEPPGAERWGAVTSTLIDAVDVVVVAPDRPVNRRDARRLVARARERDGLVFQLGAPRSWPQAVDVGLRVSTGAWEGLGRGHGLLRQRRVRVETAGRRSAAQVRSTEVLVPGPSGRLEVAGAEIHTFAPRRPVSSPPG